MKSKLAEIVTSAFLLTFPLTALAKDPLVVSQPANLQLSLEVVDHNSTLLEEHLKEFSEKFVIEALKVSESYQKAEDKFGLEKLVEKYSATHLCCLDLAKKYVSRKIPEQEYEALGEKVTMAQKEIRKASENPFAPDKESICQWVKIRTDFFHKLLSNKYKAPAYKLLVIITYTKENYEKYYAEQVEASESFYTDLRKKSNGLGAKIAAFFSGRNANEEINEAEEVASDIYKWEKEKVYGKENRVE